MKRTVAASLARHRLLLAALLLLGVFPLVHAFVVYPAFESVIVDEAAGRAETFARGLLDRPPAAPAPQAVGDLAPQREAMAAHDIAKLRVFSAQGVITASTEPGEEGTSYWDRDYFREHVAGGRVYSQLDEERTPGGEPLHLVEVYVPKVRDGAFLGAVEVYMDVTSAILSHRRVVETSSLFVLSGGFALLLVAAVVHRQMLVHQERLETNERSYRALMEEALDGIFVFDGEGAMLDANSAGCEMLGVTRNACLHLPLDRVFAADGGLDARHGVTQEATLLGPEPLPVEVSFTVLDDGRLQAIARDVSRRKRQEKALDQKRHFLESLMNAIDSPVFSKDAEGVYTGCNPAFASMLGLTADQVVGKTVYDLAPADKAEVYHQADLDLMDRGGGQRYEATVRWADGKDHDVMFSKSVIPGEEGKPAGIVGVMLDISDRKDAERALREVNEFLEDRVRERTEALERTNAELVQEVEERRRVQQELALMGQVFEHSIEGITITDPHGTILSVNPAFSAITGYDPKEVVGGNPRMLKSDRHDDAFYTKMWQDLARDGTWSGEIWNRRKNGEAYPEWLAISAIRDAEGEVSHYVAVFHDITDLKRSEERIEYQAYHDALTGLPNRLLLLDRIKVAIQHARRQKGQLALIFLDLDNFKNVNDSLGHRTGDILLQAVAERLNDVLRQADTVARFGGDEFIVLIDDVKAAEDAVHTAERILDIFRRPFLVADHELYVGASIGITLYPGDGEDPETLIKNADMAMYLAKEHGKNTFHLFTKAVNERVMRRLEIERELRAAVETRAFEPHFQPKVELASGRVYGMEALIRWPRPGREPISPAEFIPIAEETGLIHDIGRFMLEESCRFTKSLHEAGFADLVVSVNLAAQQLGHPGLVDVVKEVLDRYEYPPSRLELEITETGIMTDVDRAIAVLHKLSALGVHLSVDDFGTGYSSLYYLKRFPLETLKIDQSFVRDLEVDPDDASIVAAVISMAKSLKLQVVAEGVEKQGQLNYLRDLGCDRVQGYLYGKAMSMADFMDYIEQEDVTPS